MRKPRFVRIQQWIALSAIGVGIGFAVHGAWIPIKAEVAQVMLNRAWQQTAAGHQGVKPWPWADTWPVARLSIDEHDVDLIVLSGATGSTLAFAPGHLNGTAQPGGPGNCVFSGHRDTHFSFLRYVLPGEVIRLETPDGKVQRFRVTARHIVYDHDIHVLDESGDTTLTLLTCYPFDALVPGGPLRYVVNAELLHEA